MGIDYIQFMVVVVGSLTHIRRISATTVKNLDIVLVDVRMLRYVRNAVVTIVLGIVMDQT